MLAEGDEHDAGRVRPAAAPGGKEQARSTPAWTRHRAARWLVGLVDTLYLMCGDDGFDADAEVAELKRIAARYLGT